MSATLVPDVVMTSFFGKKALSWQHQSQTTWLIPRFLLLARAGMLQAYGESFIWVVCHYYYHGGSMDLRRADILPPDMTGQGASSRPPAPLLLPLPHCRPPCQLCRLLKQWHFSTSNDMSLTHVGCKIANSTYMNCMYDVK
jgi:hypothetical protein